MIKKSKNSINNAQQARENLELFLEKLLDEQELHLSLELEVSTAKDSLVGFTVEFNQNSVFKIFYTKGIYNVDLHLPYDCKENEIKLTMFNKSKVHDTLVQDGLIVEDTNIQIIKFHINNFDILGDADFYYNKFYYFDNDIGQSTQVKTGFWSNATLGLKFHKPFVQWYQEHTSKNAVVADSLEFMTSKQDEQFYQELLAKIEKI